MMTKFSTTAITLIMTAALAACSSGSGGGSATTPPPSTNPDTPNNPGTPNNPAPANPASNAVADLVAFAEGGTKSTRAGGVAEYDRTAADGRRVTARLMDGTKSGFVKVAQDGRITRYDLAGSPVVNADTPGGVFTGDFEVSYAMGASQPVQQARGDGFIELDMASGQAYLESGVSNAANNIFVLGEMDYANGRLTGNDMHVQVRDGEGNIDLNGNGRSDDDVWGDFGKAEGILVDNANGTSIIGVLEGQHESGFRMDGGFVVDHDPSRTIGDY